MAGDEGGLLDQSEIEALFSSIGGQKAAAESNPLAPQPGEPPKPRPSSAALPDLGELQVKPYQLSELAAAPPSAASGPDLSLLYDVDLNVRVELGRSRMYVEEILKLREGSIVPLDKLAGDPVDIYVNGQLLARGEVLVLNDNFCIRVSEIVGEKDAQAQAS